MQAAAGRVFEIQQSDDFVIDPQRTAQHRRRTVAVRVDKQLRFARIECQEQRTPIRVDVGVLDIAPLLIAPGAVVHPAIVVVADHKP